MSKHHHHHDECCYPQMSGYGMMGSYGYGGAVGGATGGCGGGAMGIRWIYALLILIVIVLQFGRRERPFFKAATGCESECETVGTAGGYGFPFNNQLIDNSVLFIIVVFLLILCAGCWFGGSSCGSGYGAVGYGGYGY